MTVRVLSRMRELQKGLMMIALLVWPVRNNLLSLKGHSGKLSVILHRKGRRELHLAQFDFVEFGYVKLWYSGYIVNSGLPLRCNGFLYDQ